MSENYSFEVCVYIHPEILPRIASNLSNSSLSKSHVSRIILYLLNLETHWRSGCH
jgi:hypothetical protein